MTMMILNKIHTSVVAYLTIRLGAMGLMLFKLPVITKTSQTFCVVASLLYSKRFNMLALRIRGRLPRICAPHELPRNRLAIIGQK